MDMDPNANRKKSDDDSPNEENVILETRSVNNQGRSNQASANLDESEEDDGGFKNKNKYKPANRTPNQDRAQAESVRNRAHGNQNRRSEIAAIEELEQQQQEEEESNYF